MSKNTAMARNTEKEKTTEMMTNPDALRLRTTSTKSDDSDVVTNHNITELFDRLEAVEKSNKTLDAGQKTILQTLDGFTENLGRLVSASVARALQQPASSSQRQNPYQEQEYSHYHRPDKQPLQEDDSNLQHHDDLTPSGDTSSAFPTLQGLTQKLQVPIFEGDNTFAWISKVERFFLLGRYSDRAKLDLVSISLDGAALGWFNSEMNLLNFADWGDFKDRVLLRFGHIDSRGPAQTLCCIKQQGPIAAYVSSFEDLVAQVHNLDAVTLEGIFLNGLKPALRDVVEMRKPKNLSEMRAYALAMESTPLTNIIHREIQSSARSTHRTYSQDNRTSSNQPWRTREVPMAIPNNTNHQPQRVHQQPRYTNDREMEEKKRLGLCFKCDGKYSRDHYKICPRRALQLLTIVNGYELEVLDKNMEHMLEEDIAIANNTDLITSTTEEDALCLSKLSLNSFLGIDSPETTKLRVFVGSHEVVMMIDSGATHNFISPDTVQQLKLPIHHNYNFQIALGTGITARGLGVCKDIKFDVGGVRFQGDFITLELGDADVILGIQWLRTLGTCHCNWKTHELSFLHKGEVVTIWGEKNLHKTKHGWQDGHPRYAFQAKGVSLQLHDTTCTTPLQQPIPEILSPVLQQFEDVFSTPKGLPPLRQHEHSINLLPGSKAVSVRPYRYPHAHKEVIEQLVQEMLHTGIIRASKSPFSSPVLLVRKKDQSWRFCVDYRALNRNTIPDKFPIPVIDQLLDELHGSVIFSKLDLKAGYHQIRMNKEDIHKTAFRTHEGHYEFLVMPFGLMNAPATFQALMNDLFKPFLQRFVLIFFDDVLVFSKSVDDHKTHLQLVLQVFQSHRLFANKKKCTFGQTHVEYLGHIISQTGVATDPTKTEAIRSWPSPTSVKALRGFLGLTGYYRRFVKGYGSLAQPLTALLKKDSFVWTRESQAAFEILKNEMCNVPTLRLPNFSEPFTVETDASSTGLGAVLLQSKQPIAFFSYGLKDREKLKSAYERELMAIVFAVNKWRHYLMGRHFIVSTDQQSLKFLLEQKEVSLEFQKWLLKLLQFDFEIIYKPGSANRVADELSRIPHQPISSHSASLMGLSLPTAIQTTELLQEIDNNEEMKELVQLLKTGCSPKPGLQLKQDRVWYKNRLYLPKTSSFIPLILAEGHSSFIGGHGGVLKTTKRIQQTVHWEGMKEVIRKFVAECAICQSHKASTLSPAGLLQPLPIPSAIWEDVSMDFIEGLPSSHGANAILVVVDRLSKFAHFLPLRHPFTAKEVAQSFITGVVKLHGFPNSIVSDRDRIFLSQFWRDFFKLSGTKLNYSTAYHPETDGQTEVLNRCLESYLRCFSSSQPRSWNKYLAWAEFAYNTSFHTAIRTTPFRVVYGRDPPAILKFEDGSTSNFDLETSLCERDNIIAEVKTHLRLAQERMQRAANKHRRDVEFSVGTRVYLKLRPYRQASVAKRICQKLSTKFFGPFKIVERIGKAAYKLQLPQGSKIHDVFHVSLLKAALGDNNPVQPLPPTLLQLEEFTIEPEKVLKSRYNKNGRLEALVQWKGLSSAENDWILVKTLIQQFPHFELGDKLLLKGGSIVKPLCVYFKKNKKKAETPQQREGSKSDKRDQTEDLTAITEVARGDKEQKPHEELSHMGKRGKDSESQLGERGKDSDLA